MYPVAVAKIFSRHRLFLFFSPDVSRRFPFFVSLRVLAGRFAQEVSPRFRPLTAFQLYVTYGLGLALELALGCYRGRVAALRSFVNLCCHASVERVAEASNWASLWARRGLRSRRFTIFPEVPSLRPMRIVYTMTHIKGEL